MVLVMHRVSFFLSPELERGLKVLKDRDGVPQAESIRRAITTYLKEKGVRTTGAKNKTKR
jgi:predicted DNA-binding protein